MGGEGSGGTRSGSPGRAYSNRSDLNTSKVPIQTTRGQAYGAATAQRAAQQAVPMASGAPTGLAPGAPPTSPSQRASVPLSAPSARPDEPVTSGLPIGPGAGPESVFAPATDAASLELRAIYQMHPSNDLLDLIEFMDAGRTY